MKICMICDLKPTKIRLIFVLKISMTIICSKKVICMEMTKTTKNQIRKKKYKVASDARNYHIHSLREL